MGHSINKLFAYLLFFYPLLFISFSCNTTEPESFIDEGPPGRRDYEWTVDTLDIYSPAYKIWGSSPSDVWCINESDYTNNLWHYDGQNWSTDGIFRFMSPYAIYGFSSNNIYIGGNDGHLWKYNGNSWNKLTELKKQGTPYVIIENLWGPTENEIYAVGAAPDGKGYFNESFIAHNLNGMWTTLNTDGIKGNVIHLYSNKPDKKIYLQLIKIGGTEHVDSTIIYEYSDGKYIPLYGNIETKGLQGDIAYINNEVYFILGNQIARRINNKFETVLNVESQDFYHRIWGRNSKDIFLLMTNGLAHYNGTDVQYLFYFNQAELKPWTQIFGAAIFEKDIFFTTYEPPTGLKLVYHGKLK